MCVCAGEVDGAKATGLGYGAEMGSVAYGGVRHRNDEYEAAHLMQSPGVTSGKVRIG